MTAEHEAKAREIVEGHIPKMAYDSFLDGDYEQLVSAISTALSEVEARERDCAAKMAEGRAGFHLAQLDVAIGEPAKLAHDMAQAELFELAALIRNRSKPDE